MSAHVGAYTKGVVSACIDANTVLSDKATKEKVGKICDGGKAERNCMFGHTAMIEGE